MEAETSAIIMLILYPMFAIGFAIVFLKEVLNPQMIIGGVLLVAAGIYLQVHIKKRIAG